jgi:hypothetical protein
MVTAYPTTQRAGGGVGARSQSTKYKQGHERVILHKQHTYTDTHTHTHAHAPAPTHRFSLPSAGECVPGAMSVGEENCT